MIVVPVNLLPKAVRTKRLQTSIITACVLGAVAGAGMVAGVSLVMQDLQRGLALAVTEGTPKRVETSSRDTLLFADAATRVVTLNTLAKREVSWSKVFDVVEAMTAKDIRVDSLSTTRGATTVTYRIAGLAPSTVSYATYLESLRSTTGALSVTEEGSTYTPATGSVSFAVSVVTPVQSVLAITGGK